MSERRSFPYSASSVARARHFVEGRLQGLSPATAESVVLLVSELATNCIRHAHTGFNLELEVAAEHLRVRVADGGRGEPEIQSPGPTETSGRGLLIVESLADSWGVIPSTPEQGKTVWFVMSTRTKHRRLEGVL